MRKHMLQTLATTLLLGMGLLACSKNEPYEPQMKDAKQQETDAREMWENTEE